MAERWIDQFTDFGDAAAAFREDPGEMVPGPKLPPEGANESNFARLIRQFHADNGGLVYARACQLAQWAAELRAQHPSPDHIRTCTRRFRALMPEPSPIRPKHLTSDSPSGDSGRFLAGVQRAQRWWSSRYSDCRRRGSMITTAAVVERL
jgi:hypothetical protein